MQSLSHWTSKGVFEIMVEPVRGNTTIVLRFNDQVLGRFLYVGSACASVADGTWDEKLGFKASELDVPRAPGDWKGLR
jgi:hypothetical protein